MNLDPALNTFLQEGRELLQDMEQLALRLDADPADREAVDAMFRAAHTIKGSAGLFGMQEIVSFTHVVENTLDKLRSGSLEASAPLMAVLLRCCDHMGALVEACVAAGGDRAIEPRLGTEGKALLDALTQLIPSRVPTASLTVRKQAALSAPPPSPDAADQGSPRVENPNWHISIRFGRDVLRNGMDPRSFLLYLGRLGEIVHISTLLDALPPAAEMDPESCYLGFEIMLHADTTKEAIESVFEFILHDCTLRILPPHSQLAGYIDLIWGQTEGPMRVGEILVQSHALTTRELEQALHRQKSEEPRRPVGEILIEQAAVPPEVVDAALAKQKEGQERKSQESKTIRVDAEKLDSLINFIGELVISGASTTLLARRSGDRSVIESTEIMGRLVGQIRDSAMHLRMVQIGETFRRFARVVRDVSRALDKDIELQVSGGETELDKAVVEKIADPLMHLVRNSLDHGIEARDVRLSRGKPARGHLSLHACHDSGSVVIEVSDDGGGLDREKILERARARGLVRPDAKPSDEAILNLIFAPGFSTKEVVSDLSGRGVGMDVVKRNIEALRGTVELSSETGAGTTTRIRLPLTLAIIDGFLVGVGRSAYVVPLDTVVECVDLADQGRSSDDQRSYINLRGTVLPFLRLRDLFHQEAAEGARRENVVVVQCGRERAGLVVDELMGEFQAVIKPLGKMFRNMRGISGSTVLGTGDVALILDVPALVQRIVNSETKDRGIHA